MDFDRPWTLDALYAEHDTCGMGRIMRSHNASVEAAESALAAANKRADEADKKLKVRELELKVAREAAQHTEKERRTRWLYLNSPDTATIGQRAESLIGSLQQNMRALQQKLAAQSRELAILREYAEASEMLRESGWGFEPLIRFRSAEESLRRFKEAGDA